MANSTPLVGILALLVVVAIVVVVVPVGPEPLMPAEPDPQQTWDEYQVENPSLHFSAGVGLLLFNLVLMLGLLSCSLLSYRDPDEEEPWRELSCDEDEE